MGVLYEWLKLAWCLPASFCRCLRCPRNCQGGQEEGKQAPSHLPLFQAERLCLCWVGKWWAKDWNIRRGLLLERTIVNMFKSLRWSPTLSWSRNWGPESLNATFQFPQGGCDRSRTRPHSCNSHPCSPTVLTFWGGWIRIGPWWAGEGEWGEKMGSTTQMGGPGEQGCEGECRWLFPGSAEKSFLTKGSV